MSKKIDDPTLPRPQKLTPNLTCRGAAEAITFYGRAFGATEMIRIPGPDGLLMHACVRLNDSLVFLTDENCGGMTSPSPSSLGGTAVSLHLDVEDVDAAVERAVSAGATIVMPVEDMFWGDRFGVIEDPFGHRWTLATRQRVVTEEELMQGAAAAFAR